MRRLMMDSPTRAADPPVMIHLLGGPPVSGGAERRPVPEGSKRLVAYVALKRSPVERARAAGMLWPETDDARAAGNLRSALWWLRGAGIDVLVGQVLPGPAPRRCRRHAFRGTVGGPGDRGAWRSR
jgi:hypothetical protein